MAFFGFKPLNFYFLQMDALIATFVDELKQRVAMYNEDPDGNLFNDVSSTEADGEDTDI